MEPIHLGLVSVSAELVLSLFSPVVATDLMVISAYMVAALGIAPKDLPHIFEPFYRGQSVIAATTSGTGLGLCLVERNLRALGGSVTVQSAPGDGTSFTLHLPVS